MRLFNFDRVSDVSRQAPPRRQTFLRELFRAYP
jgi:hypothetical protein